MRPRLIAFDYDGTLAEDGVIRPATLAALADAKAAGLRLAIVTGRPHDELVSLCPDLDLFDLVVDENGAVLYFPATGEVADLGPAPPPEFIAELARREVRFGLGRIVVRTWRPHLEAAHEAIRALDLALDVIPNKYAVMIVPRGTDKGTGLEAGLVRLGVAPAETMAVGDDENDRAVFRVAGGRVAVANAVEALKAEADRVTRRPCGEGVVELLREHLL